MASTTDSADIGGVNPGTDASAGVHYQEFIEAHDHATPDFTLGVSEGMGPYGNAGGFATPQPAVANEGAVRGTDPSAA